MSWFVEVLASVLLIAGGIFLFIGSMGMVHLRDFYMRLHGPTKATTLGIGCMLIASTLFFWSQDGKPDIQELLITLFLFITAPVSAHLLSKAGLHMQLHHIDITEGDPVELREEEVAQKPVPHPDKGHG